VPRTSVTGSDLLGVLLDGLHRLDATRKTYFGQWAWCGFTLS
jgi:hypothetical protein